MDFIKDEILSRGMIVLSSHLNTTAIMIFKIIIKSLIMRCLAKMLSFCYREAPKNTKLKHLGDIIKLKDKIDQEYFYIRKNHKQIGQDIQKFIRAEQWYSLVKRLNLININQLDSWLTLRKIAHTFRNVLNKQIDINFIDDEELQRLTKVMCELRYEPISKTEQNKDNYLYDDIETFSIMLNSYFTELKGLKVTQSYLRLAKNLIHTNPQLFIDKKQEIEVYLWQILQQQSQFTRFHMTDLLSKGCMSQFWSQQFRNKVINYVYEKGLDHRIIKALQFSSKFIPTKIEANNQNQNRIKTEIDIINILQGYDYDIQHNVYINGYEVDVLISGFLAVEYNGHHHYAINSDKLVPTVKQQWRTNIFNQRGIIVSSIPYTEFKYIKHFEDKRLYLVDKIEKDLINQRKILK